MEGKRATTVSVKGVLVVDSRVLLLANDRDEWELPGGRPEPGESEREALARELREETGQDATIGPRIGREAFEVIPGRIVEIVSYGCVSDAFGIIRLSAEHGAHLWAPIDSLEALPVPGVYIRHIRLWIKMADIRDF